MTEKDAGKGNIVRIVRFVKGDRGPLPTEAIVRKLLYPFLAPSGWRVRGEYFGNVVLVMLEGPRNGDLGTSLDLFKASIDMREKEIRGLGQRNLREEEKRKNESTEFATISFLNNWNFPYSGSPSGIEDQIFNGMVLVEITKGLPENLEKAKAIMQHMAIGLAAATK